ncbi:MAG: GNAT family N-acetyltransferase [Xanthomonadaceae bacterium]|nr:GNAT family N-acetyltransferase [Xanthomonadaceae bacterium]
MSDIEPSMFECETGRLRLRTLQADDEALFHALYTDPETMRFIGTPLSAEQASGKFLKIVRRQAEPVLDGRYLVMVEKNTRKSLGICGTGHYDQEAMRIEVGMVLTSAGRGQGFATEALAALVDQVFEQHPMEVVYARFDAGNAAAWNLVSRLGFAPEVVAEGLEQASTNCRWSVQRSRWHASNITNSQGITDVQCDRLS